MMTIDEAIEKHRKIAEMYRCEYECDCDYYGKDFIDDYADELDYIKNMHEHEQLADWLEELKMYKEVGTVEGYKSAIECYNEEYIIRKSNKQYNKAIDDFVAFTKEYEYKYGNANITSIVIGFNKFIAEQLKAGGEK